MPKISSIILFGFLLLFNESNCSAQPQKILSILPYWSYNILEGFEDSVSRADFFAGLEADTMIKHCMIVQNFDNGSKAKIALSYDEVNWGEYLISPNTAILFNRIMPSDSIGRRVFIRVFTSLKTNPDFFKEYLIEDKRCILLGWYKSSGRWDAWFTDCQFP